MLTVITFLPLLSVAALLMLRSDDQVWIRRIALAASLAEFVVSLLLLRGFDSANPDYQFVEKHAWIGDSIQYHLGVDGISLFLILLTTFLTPLAILCSWESIRDNVKGFFVSLLVIETAMIGVFVSLDLFLFFVFWELTLIPMYFMIGMWAVSYTHLDVYKRQRLPTGSIILLLARRSLTVQAPQMKPPTRPSFPRCFSGSICSRLRRPRS